MKESVCSFRFDYGDALFRLYQFNISENGDDSPLPVHGHQFYELHFAFEGEYSYVIGDEKITLSRGQMLLIPPDTPHLAVDPNCDSYKYAVISFSLNRQDGENGCFLYFKNTIDATVKRPLTANAALASLAKGLTERSYADSVEGICAYKVKATTFIYELFDSLNGFHSKHQPPKVGQNEEDRLVLLETLVNQPHRRIDEIAEAINYSPRHTARLIRSIYGMSLSEIRKSQKIKNKR